MSVLPGDKEKEAVLDKSSTQGFSRVTRELLAGIGCILLWSFFMCKL